MTTEHARTERNQAAVPADAGWLEAYVDRYERDPDFVAEGLALRFVEEALKIMADRGISRSDLAGLMGVSRAYVTKMLNAPPNLTLRSIAQLAIALDAEPTIELATTPTASRRNTSDRAAGRRGGHEAGQDSREVC